MAKVGEVVLLASVVVRAMAQNVVDKHEATEYSLELTTPLFPGGVKSDVVQEVPSHIEM
jgi:hypothetical protein